MKDCAIMILLERGLRDRSSILRGMQSEVGAPTSTTFAVHPPSSLNVGMSATHTVDSRLLPRSIHVPAGDVGEVCYRTV